MINPYHVLGVHRESTDEEIKARHRILCREHHPDRGGDQDTFLIVQMAYGMIRNAGERKLTHTKMLGLMEPCAGCSGAGVLRTRKGWVTTGKKGCATCNGSGFVGR